MPYKVFDARPADLRERIFLPEAVRGVAIIAKQFWRNFFLQRDANPDVLARKTPNVTIQYPEEKQPYPPGYRGLHRLVPREDGTPRCVACYMCATVCPAQCIYIEADEASDAIEKAPRKFVIDELRCVVCGFCVEACPKDAIRMDTGEHAVPTYTRAAQCLDEKQLLRGPAVSYQYDPWLRRKGGAEGIEPAKLEAMRASARPFPQGAGDDYAQTPGFSVRQLAAEAKGRGER